MALSWNQRFLTTTRGRIVILLRRGGRTVNELAAAMELTDNAVRAHLATLERDGLIVASGSRPGSRKPNVVYELTAEAGQMFPKSHGTILGLVLDALAERMSPAQVEEVLRAAGHRAAAACRPLVQGPDLKTRLQQALTVLEGMGGLAEVEEEGGRIFLRGFDCPLSNVAAGHPEVCRLAEALLTDLIGAPVQERCVPATPPRCLFEVQPLPSEAP